jgi:chemotaxis protein histidine kinase CheA
MSDTMSEPSSAALPPGADFQQALQRFRDEFARQVPARVAEADACLSACRADPADAARLRELHRVVHKLAGTAGTFGMSRLGDAARAIEQRIEALLEQPQRGAADFDALVPAVAGLVAVG